MINISFISKLKCNFIIFTHTITSATTACFLFFIWNYRSPAFISAIAFSRRFRKEIGLALELKIFRVSFTKTTTESSYLNAPVYS